jgi:hypothetical protein
VTACSEFHAMILVAEPEELRAEGGSALAVHIRGCPDCARTAALVLEETARLDAYLGEAPAIDVDAVLARAGIPTAASALVATHPAVQRKAAARTRRSFPGRRVWLPLAAAAALAALLLMRGPGIRSPSKSVASAPTGPAPAPLVEPVAGQDAAIMNTDDPEITVVWLFSTG